MVDKALLAAGSGFTTSVVPGAAVALFAVDVAASFGSCINRFSGREQ